MLLSQRGRHTSVATIIPGIVTCAFLVLATFSSSPSYFCLCVKDRGKPNSSGAVGFDALAASRTVRVVDCESNDSFSYPSSSFSSTDTSSPSGSSSSSSPSSTSSTYSSSSPIPSRWNLSALSSTLQLDVWRDRVAKAYARASRLEHGKPVRVYVSHGRWMTRTSAPSTLQPDGSFLIDDCSVPCAVEFNEDGKEGRHLHRPDPAASFDWTAWTTSPSVRAADVVVQVDQPWEARQLRQFRALYPRKRAVFASWEPLGTAYRTASALSDRRYDWLASFTFSGENAADVPSTYEGLDHSDSAVAAFYQKLRRRPSSNDADESKRPSKGTASSFFCRGTKSPVFMAVSNCASKQRQLLLSAFIEVLPVDSYGNCLHNSDLGADLLPGCAALKSKDWREQKACMMSCYPFVLSVESTQSELDYATEKLFDPLLHDSVIPIYLGPPNEREFLPRRSAAILVRDFSSRKRGRGVREVVVDEETMRRVARYVALISRNVSAMHHLQSWRTELDEQSFSVGMDGQPEGSKSITETEDRNKSSFPFALRSWFSHRRFFCNLCTRYAAESVGIFGYDIGA